MTIHVYTSQSINYFNDIGKYSLASVLKFLPEDTKITVTTEEFAIKEYVSKVLA
jgi:hypothetical protein